MRDVIVKKTDRISKCPKCGNNVNFKAFSSQVAEDLCNIWVECACGYDPTAEDTNNRYEDVWGAITEGTVSIALDCWNDAIGDLSENGVPK